MYPWDGDYILALYNITYDMVSLYFCFKFRQPHLARTNVNCSIFLYCCYMIYGGDGYYTVEFVDTSQENEISVCSSEEEESEDSNEEYEEEARGSCCKDMKSLFGSGEGDAEMLERPKRSLPVSLMCALVSH